MTYPASQVFPSSVLPMLDTFYVLGMCAKQAVI